MLRLTELEVDQEPGQPTSVLVLNIGAEAGARCPAEHWIYVPENRSGFHRVGFYSNVDRSFLPRGAENRVSMYVERSCLRGRRPNAEQERIYTGSVLDELREWEWIGKADVVSPAWVEVAYTWSMPRSRWRTRAMGLLKEHGILMTGRYGKWRFQGIADSMGDGFACGSKMRSRGE